MLERTVNSKLSIFSMSLLNTTLRLRSEGALISGRSGQVRAQNESEVFHPINGYQKEIGHPELGCFVGKVGRAKKVGT